MFPPAINLNNPHNLDYLQDEKRNSYTATDGFSKFQIPTGL